MNDSKRAATSWPVMVLAHNEEQFIEECLDSIFLATTHPLRVYVMANGCTDGTERIVSEYARRRPEVKLCSIKLGDKCNAWNVFVHETAVHECPAAEVYFFVDGDATFSPGSFDALAAGLKRNAHAHAASAVPITGRSRERDAAEILAERGLVANLYALRGEFVKALQAAGVRIPLKLEGDDGLIGALVKWDLQPGKGWDSQRIEPCGDAGFAFRSFSPWRLRDWRGYWKRMVRYERRHFEFKILGPVLESSGLGAMPTNIQDLYSHANRLSPRINRIHALASWFALREMREIAANRPAAAAASAHRPKAI